MRFPGRHVATFAALLLPALTPAAAQVSPLTQVVPGTWLAHGSAGNVVVTIGADAVVVIGPQVAAEVPALRREIARLSHAPVRFVVVTASPVIEANRDGGWTRAGATVIAEEHAAYRMAAGTPLAADLSTPALGFSEVQQIHAADDDIHVVRQKPGSTAADISAHLERAGVLYLGDAFTADGYPTVDEANGGSFTGLVETAAKFMTFNARTKIIPGRGGVSTPADLRAYHDMLEGIGARVKALRAQGKSLDAVIAARPSAPWDARWGKAPGSAREIVTAAYRALEAPARDARR